MSDDGFDLYDDVLPAVTEPSHAPSVVGGASGGLYDPSAPSRDDVGRAPARRVGAQHPYGGHRDASHYPGNNYIASPSYKGPPGDSRPRKVFLENLQWWTTDAQLEEILGQHGKIVELKFFEQKENGKSKGQACVEFYEPDAAIACVERLNGMEIDGKLCTASFDGGHLQNTYSRGHRGGNRGGHGGVGMMRGGGFRGRGRGGRGGIRHPGPPPGAGPHPGWPMMPPMMHHGGFPMAGFPPGGGPPPGVFMGGGPGGRGGHGGPPPDHSGDGGERRGGGGGGGGGSDRHGGGGGRRDDRDRDRDRDRRRDYDGRGERRDRGDGGRSSSSGRSGEDRDGGRSSRSRRRDEDDRSRDRSYEDSRRYKKSREGGY